MNFINPERNSSEGLGEMEIKETAPLVKSRTYLIEPRAYTAASFFHGFMVEFFSEVMIPHRLINPEFRMLLPAGIITSALYLAPVETWLTKYKNIFLGTALGITASHYLLKISQL